MQNYKPKFKIKSRDKKRYVFPRPRDYEILYKIYQLEKKNISSQDMKMISFIRMQLMKDWRKPLLKVLDSLLKKYK